MIFARRAAFALLLAGFRTWKRLPPAERKRMMHAVQRHGPRLASSLLRQRRARL